MQSWLMGLANAADAFRQSRILLTASELDLFTVLGGRSLSAQQIARRLGSDPRATGLWLDALVGLGVLGKRDGRYSNTSESRTFLDKRSSAYRGAWLRHMARMWAAWDGLTETVMRGEPRARRDRDDGTAAEFAWAMYGGALERADQVAAALWPEATARRGTGPSQTALDLGGGPGHYAVAMVKRNPSLRAVVFDRPEMLEVARTVARREGLTKRIRLLPGDFFQDDIGAGYDVVLASNVIHSYAEPQVQQIIRLCADALAPGGRLVVHDYLLDESMTQPLEAAVFAVHMLVVGAAGRSYSAGEVRQWMLEAGLRAPRQVALPNGSTSLLIARSQGGG